MAKKFKYDIYSLIESKECLWDKTKEVSKDKVLRRNAWRDVCAFLEPNFEDMDQKNKDEITSAVMIKWSNIRDIFIKSLKTKSGQAAKKYIYSDNLQFLLKTATPDETDSSIPTQNDSESLPESQQTSHSNLDQSIPSPSTSTSTSTMNRRGTKRLNAVYAEILKAIQANSAESESELIDDDRAFMISLLPSVKQLNDEDRFDFRIEVMQLLRRFKNRSRFATPSDHGNFHQLKHETQQYAPQQGNQLISPQHETQQYAPQQGNQLISPQHETQQFTPQQQIKSISGLFSQDFSKN
ncbi:unnamed protein product [Acanthoscelides obtectus]|uniref:MADF domain-containing protein n=1 Tax=Acanthoscelides obtectus TaxID=200917 RepID=A0A9P0LX72_ACAOB|nr:unnamed protein product [Acanthoscelides obtectus]CAK1623575.1 hypothetical protein AOBTE_LOCUS2079 [Acanthoscelides obtectus]